MTNFPFQIIFTLTLVANTFTPMSNADRDKAPRQVQLVTSTGEEISLNIPDQYPLLKQDPLGNYFVAAVAPSKRMPVSRANNEYVTPLDLTGDLDSGIIGNDDRVVVADTTLFPYSAVVQIETRNVPTGTLTGICTGWLFGPRVIATVAHCIYDSRGYFQDKYSITPGLNASAGTPKPFGSCSVRKGAVLRAYVSPDTPPSEKSNYDFGLIVLDCNVGEYTGYFGYRQLSSGTASMKVRVTGYPGDKGGVTMWTAVGDQRGAIGSSDRILKYYTDATVGESGGPAIENVYPACQNCAIAVQNQIESSGADVYNTGVKVDDAIFAVLEYYRNLKEIYLPVLLRE